MKSKTLFLLMLLPLSFILTACTATKSISQNVGEKIAEKTIESQTGAKVDIDSNGNDVTIKSKDGQTQFSSGGNLQVPENFPKELIVASDAKIIMASSSPQGTTLSYVTLLEQTDIKEKQLTKMTELGWEKDMEITSEGYMASFSKDNQKVTITIGNNDSSDIDGKAMVNVIYVTE